MIEISELGFGYPDGIEVLAGLSTSVGAGSIVGIVGPSGCGKSTLLYLIAELLAPTRGTLKLAELEPGRHPISMVFQKDTLLPWLTVAENVRFYERFQATGARQGIARTVGRLRRGRGRKLDERTEELLTLVHLEDRADAYPYQLSGGMRRRVQFLMGVAPNPQILLLDEPFSAVDEPTRIGIHQDVEEIVRRLGITTVLVTHDLAEAIALCDRVMILSNRPAHVAKEQLVPFGATRDMLHLRGTAEFLELYGRLWDDLSEQILASALPPRLGGPRQR